MELLAQGQAAGKGRIWDGVALNLTFLTAIFHFPRALCLAPGTSWATSGLAG